MSTQLTSRKLEKKIETLEKEIAKKRSFYKNKDEYLNLRETEARFNLLMRNSPLGVIYIDATGQILHTNFKATDIFSTLSTKALRKINVLKFKPFVKAGLTKNIRECIRKNTSDVVEHHFGAGSEKGFYLRIYLSPVMKETGDGQELQMIVEDISERKKIETQVLHSHKMEAIGMLAGGVAHDFNNILWIINGNAELAMPEIPDGNPARYHLDLVVKACQRAQELVMQIISFSRKTEQEHKSLKISSIIKESLKLLRASIPSNIKIRYHFSNRFDKISANLTKINQMLMNLYMNAVQAMVESGGLMEISLVDLEITDKDKAQGQELDSGKYVILSILDTGHGIDKEIINRIFDPFFTTRGFEEHTGMGLAVVNSIVQNHGGNITVQSEKGSGAIFHIILPVIEEEAVRETEEFEELLKGNEHVFFIDDDKQVLKMGKRMLERLGYRVTVSLNPLEALTQFKNDPDAYDLVITDHMMPEMTGAELSEKFMKIRSDISIILCTGFSEIFTEQKAKKMGIQDYVLKPIKMSELAKTVRTILDRKKASQ